jgi:XTP/dITP diphosphohydrolase
MTPGAGRVARREEHALTRLVVATNNKGKLAEIRAVLADLPVELVAQSDLGVPEAEETGSTFVENALLKARQATRLTGLAAMADDSGLLVDALDGAPGLITAHWAGVHGDSARNIAKLLHALDGVPETRRGATFLSVIVLLRRADDPDPLIVEGRWCGRILDEPRGTGGFGYDPVFFDPLHGQGAGEMDAALKNQLSHRGQALLALRARLAGTL